MSFNWLAYLELADYMLAHKDNFPDEEACCRAVISRAYYGVFGAVRQHFEATGEFESYGDEHKQLQRYLKKHPHALRRRLGNQLDDLHRHRKKADYDATMNGLPENNAKLAMGIAHRIKAGLESLA